MKEFWRRLVALAWEAKAISSIRESRGGDLGVFADGKFEFGGFFIGKVWENVGKSAGGR